MCEEMTRVLISALAMLVCCLTGLRITPVASAAPELEAVLVRMMPDRSVRVESVPLAYLGKRGSSDGLLIWRQDDQDRWTDLPMRDIHGVQTSFFQQLGAAARGEASVTSADSPFLTASIDQLLGQSRMRDMADFLTPIPGLHVDPQVTIRRHPQESSEEKFPAVEAVMIQNGTTLLKIPFAAGQEKVGWSQIPALPEGFSQGLPPGHYSLALAGKSRSVEFDVMDPQGRDWLMKPVRELGELLGNTDDPLYLQLYAERLLDNDAPADALDVLERASEQKLTAYLRRLRVRVRSQLAGDIDVPETADSDATGIDFIDFAREQIAASQWETALDTLALSEETADERARGLALLYRAVILAESGQATGLEADQVFDQALEAIEQLNPPRSDDACRAYNNYANHLLNRAQDKLYNHAFQLAAGTATPLISLMDDWLRARKYYEASVASAQQLETGQQLAVSVNVARLDAMLADVIHVLDNPVDGPRHFEATEQAAIEQARQTAASVLNQNGGEVDHLTSAVSHEILAHLAYRQHDLGPSRTNAQQAQQHYLEVGSLAGVESVQRLLGLLHLRDEQQGNSDPESKTMALRNLLISQLLAEVLRERIPADRIGLTRAGFLAHRATSMINSSTSSCRRTNRFAHCNWPRPPKRDR